jgi:hypothetical protein
MITQGGHGSKLMAIIDMCSRLLLLVSSPILPNIQSDRRTAIIIVRYIIEPSPVEIFTLSIPIYIAAN